MVSVEVRRRARARSLVQVALAALAVALALPSFASAQNRNGVVLRFPGWRGGQARSQVIRALEGRVTLTPRGDIEAAARGAGASLSDAEGMSTIAAEFGLQFFVQGRVRGRGGRARTVIQIYDANGNEIARREGPRPVGAARLRRIRARTLEAFEQAEASIAQAEAAEAERQRQEEAARQRELEAQLENEVIEEPVEEPSTEGALPRIQALVGLDLRKRSADIDLGAAGGRRYRAGFYPEITLELRSFPAGAANSALRGIYTQFDFAVALGLSTQERDLAGNLGPEIGTSAWRLALHAGYVYPIADDTVRIGGIVGFGVDNFDIDENMTMASSRYTYLRIGLLADARLYEELLRARVDFGFRAVFGVGDLVPNFGASSSQNAIDLGLGVYGKIDLGITYGLRFGYVRTKVDFSGVAGMGPAAATAEELTDTGVSFGLQVGYTY
ncbi:MAG: hypothetical protein AAGE52_03535 [Myxococcota bacterium]